MDAPAEGQAKSDGVKTLAPSSAWYLTQITDKQRRYGIAIIQTEGDWKAAATIAGYSDKTPQASIEGGEAMTAYMQHVKDEIAMAAGLTAESLISRLMRISLKAEAEGDYAEARANMKLLGEYLGIWKTAPTTFNFNHEGHVIQISNARPANTAGPSDEEIEILRQNGFNELADRALAARVIEAEVIEDGSTG